jgi:hypothetical protein
LPRTAASEQRQGTVRPPKRTPASSQVLAMQCLQPQLRCIRFHNSYSIPFTKIIVSTLLTITFFFDFVSLKNHFFEKKSKIFFAEVNIKDLRRQI